ncbi:TetR/AcrR family transcriptional regulator [Dyella humicola]|uniref:TetR/AcrR family transcriptional regulator n=1 Tax=Dyella humicola TaxID=2992126 RepID=UPI0022561693|nr:TetR/AcrR family transcriptional regulator [Dyella humicola]
MRYDKGHKEATRQRIIEAAAARFREEGIAAVGVANLMSDIGLTQGGFYNHFESKDDLAREAIMLAWQGTYERLRKALERAKHGGIAALIDTYLSESHRNRVAEGCVAAALSAEIARGSESLRDAFSEGTAQTTALIAGALPGNLTPKQRHGIAMAVLSSLVGTLMLARAVSDPAMSDELLAQGRRAALALAEVAK